MSSATSTSGQVRLKADGPGRGGFRMHAADDGFRPWHFFVLASLMAATFAVILSRQSTPEHLVLMSITIAAAGFAAAGFYRMLAPLVGEQALTAVESLSERERTALERERRLAFRALKDLEFDRAMGKLSQKDFEEMAARLRARAMSLMKQLDEAGPGYHLIIERELSARLAQRGRQPPASPDAPADPVQPAAGTCACGTTNDPDALFCKRCGTKL